jgi:hypothetical protein
MSGCGWLVQDLDVSAPPNAPLLFAVAIDDPYEAERIVACRLKRNVSIAATLMQLPGGFIKKLHLAPGQFAMLDGHTAL